MMMMTACNLLRLDLIGERASGYSIWQTDIKEQKLSCFVPNCAYKFTPATENYEECNGGWLWVIFNLTDSQKLKSKSCRALFLTVHTNSPPPQTLYKVIVLHLHCASRVKRRSQHVRQSLSVECQIIYCVERRASISACVSSVERQASNYLLCQASSVDLSMCVECPT